MWAIEYSDEVKFYFIDNYPYTFDLLVRIEELKFFADAIPPEGNVQLEPNLYLWQVAEHEVIYETAVAEHRLIIAIVRPIDSTL